MQLLHRVKLFRYLEMAVFLLLHPIYAQDCRRTINVTSTPQVMTSPGWPRHYLNNMDCRWDLNVSPGSRMRIQFTNISTQECCDRVQIFDPGHPFIYTLSGNITDINLQSKAPRLTVRFRTDGSVTSYGFFATVVETVTSQVVPTTTSPPTVSCGYNATATESPQQLVSPGYPESYANNLDCLWRIQARPNKRIRLYVPYFSTEACCDHLLIYDGHEEVDALYGRLLSPLTFTTTGNLLQLRFTTDRSYSYEGFIANFSEVEATDGVHDGATTPFFLKHLLATQSTTLNYHLQRTAASGADTKTGALPLFLTYLVAVSVFISFLCN